MAEHEKATKSVQEELKQKHRKKQQESEPSYEPSLTWDTGPFSLKETPFYPRMSEHAARLSRIPFSAQRHEFIMRLNNTYGYRYVQRLVEAVNAQTKLTISEPGDIYEQEADRVAEEVIRSINSPVQRQMPEEEEELQMQEEEEELQTTPLLQRQDEEEEELVQGKLVQRETPEEEEELLQGKIIQRETSEEEEELLQGKFIQRQAPEEEEELVQGKITQRQTPEEEEELQMQEDEEELQAQLNNDKPSSVSIDIETRINNAHGGGQPLAEEVREPMEQAFGADFSNVRTHSDREADKLNQELSAKAFTTGWDIFFRDGEYSPGSESGRKLIAHELTHVVQQRNESSTFRKVNNLTVPQQPNPWKPLRTSSFKRVKIVVAEYNAMNGTERKHLQSQVAKLDDIRQKIQVWNDRHQNPQGKELLRKNELDALTLEVATEKAAVRAQIGVIDQRFKTISDTIKGNKTWNSATPLDDVLSQLRRLVINNQTQLNILNTAFVINRTKLVGEAAVAPGIGEYSPEINELKISTGNADIMADTLIFEAGNAYRGGRYRAIKGEPYYGRQTPVWYGDVKSAIEAEATLDYLDYVIKLVDDDGININTLPEKARRQYNHFKQIHPEYWSMTPTQKLAFRRTYATEFAQTPQRAQAPAGTRMNLGSGDLYAYEEVVRLRPGAILSMIRHQMDRIADIRFPDKAGGWFSLGMPMRMRPNIANGARGMFYKLAVERAEVYYDVDLTAIKFNTAQITVAQNECPRVPQWDQATTYFEAPVAGWQRSLPQAWRDHLHWINPV